MAGWAQVSVYAWWRRENFLPLAGIKILCKATQNNGGCRESITVLWKKLDRLAVMQYRAERRRTALTHYSPLPYSVLLTVLEVCVWWNMMTLHIRNKQRCRGMAETRSVRRFPGQVCGRLFVLLRDCMVEGIDGGGQGWANTWRICEGMNKLAVRECMRDLWMNIRMNSTYITLHLLISYSYVTSLTSQQTAMGWFVKTRCSTWSHWGRRSFTSRMLSLQPNKLCKSHKGRD